MSPEHAGGLGLDVVLLEPRIPPNTGNIIRLCANTGCRLHLVSPLGFQLDSARVRRAGLDYHEMAVVTVHAGLPAARAALPGRWLAFSSHATARYDRIGYRPGDVLLFGPEPTGLPDDVRAGFPGDQVLRLPMVPGSRSLNLSNAVSVVLYEAWRQLGFAGSC